MYEDSHLEAAYEDRTQIDSDYDGFNDLDDGPYLDDDYWEDDGEDSDYDDDTKGDFG